jgi:Mor family transcriptional regulator
MLDDTPVTQYALDHNLTLKEAVEQALPKKGKLSAETISAIVESYINGDTLEELSKRHNTNPAHICNLLDKLNIQRRSRGRSRAALNKQTIEQQRLQGLSLRALARLHSVSHETIRKTLKETQPCLSQQS